MANRKAVATTRRHLKFKKTDKPFRKHGPLLFDAVNNERIFFFFFFFFLEAVAQPFFFFTGFSQPTLDNH